MRHLMNRYFAVELEYRQKDLFDQSDFKYARFDAELKCVVNKYFIYVYL